MAALIASKFKLCIGDDYSAATSVATGFVIETQRGFTQDKTGLRLKTKAEEGLGGLFMEAVADVRRKMLLDNAAEEAGQWRRDSDQNPDEAREGHAR